MMAHADDDDVHTQQHQLRARGRRFLDIAGPLLREFCSSHARAVLLARQGSHSFPRHQDEQLNLEEQQQRQEQADDEKKPSFQLKLLSDYSSHDEQKDELDSPGSQLALKQHNFKQNSDNVEKEEDEDEEEENDDDDDDEYDEKGKKTDMLALDNGQVYYFIKSEHESNASEENENPDVDLVGMDRFTQDVLLPLMDPVAGPSLQVLTWECLFVSEALYIRNSTLNRLSEYLIRAQVLLYLLLEFCQTVSEKTSGGQVTSETAGPAVTLFAVVFENLVDMAPTYAAAPFFKFLIHNMQKIRQIFSSSFPASSTSVEEGSKTPSFTDEMKCLAKVITMALKRTVPILDKEVISVALHAANKLFPVTTKYTSNLKCDVLHDLPSTFPHCNVSLPSFETEYDKKEALLSNILALTSSSDSAAGVMEALACVNYEGYAELLLRLRAKVIEFKSFNRSAEDRQLSLFLRDIASIIIHFSNLSNLLKPQISSMAQLPGVIRDHTSFLFQEDCVLFDVESYRGFAEDVAFRVHVACEFLVFLNVLLYFTPVNTASLGHPNCDVSYSVIDLRVNVNLTTEEELLVRSLRAMVVTYLLSETLTTAKAMSIGGKLDKVNLSFVRSLVELTRNENWWLSWKANWCRNPIILEDEKKEHSLPQQSQHTGFLETQDQQPELIKMEDNQLDTTTRKSLQHDVTIDFKCVTNDVSVGLDDIGSAGMNALLKDFTIFTTETDTEDNVDTLLEAVGDRIEREGVGDFEREYMLTRKDLWRWKTYRTFSFENVENLTTPESMHPLRDVWRRYKKQPVLTEEERVREDQEIEEMQEESEPEEEHLSTVEEIDSENDPNLEFDTNDASVNTIPTTQDEKKEQKEAEEADTASVASEVFLGYNSSNSQSDTNHEEEENDAEKVKSDGEGDVSLTTTTKKSDEAFLKRETPDVTITTKLDNSSNGNKTSDDAKKCTGDNSKANKSEEDRKDQQHHERTRRSSSSDRKNEKDNGRFSSRSSHDRFRQRRQWDRTNSDTTSLQHKYVPIIAGSPRAASAAPSVIQSEKYNGRNGVDEKRYSSNSSRSNSRFEPVTPNGRPLRNDDSSNNESMDIIPSSGRRSRRSYGNRSSSGSSKRMRYDTAKQPPTETNSSNNNNNNSEIRRQR